MPKKTKTTDEKQEAIKIVKASKGRRGVTVTARDGRLFFLTDAQARRAAFTDKGGAYAKFLAKSKVKKDAGCGILKGWLDSHSPNSRKWRKISLIWGGRC